MTKPAPTQRSGIAGLLFVFCLAALLAGLGFDYGAGARTSFWIGGQVGAAAAIGVGATAFVIISARLAQAVLGRRTQAAKKGGNDAGPDA